MNKLQTLLKMSKKDPTKIFLIALLLNCILCIAHAQPIGKHDLYFNDLSTRWDDGMPLGNGMLGALIWNKDGKLRISLDRADLWDEREALDLKKISFAWVQKQVAKNDYDTVHKIGDDPYEASPFPTKIPAGALEFNVQSLGKVKSVHLNIQTALCTVDFANGVRFNNYIHATTNTGYFSFENLTSVNIIPELVVPGYNTGKQVGNGNSVEGLGLEKLGYPKGTVIQNGNRLIYHQPTLKGNYYEILVTWQILKGNRCIGQWTITNNKPASLPKLDQQAKEPTNWDTHKTWWKHFWQQSSINIPDTLLEKQYYLELYKLGCVSRKGSPAITLQAVWTADNGNLPPWKGDFHHDLNTELSYWPCYTGNHLQEADSYTDWLWKIKPVNEQFTKQYFGVKGLAVPGVTTLNGKAMGGWIQYSLSPSTSSWLAQHFYWQWKYSMDAIFLKERAYPYLHEVATFIENATHVENGKRLIALSSSPEYHDNSIKAWFTSYTNYDLALYKYALHIAAEAAEAMHKNEEALHWKAIQKELPEYDVNETGLTIAAGQNLDESHRHHAQLMAIYPLGLLNTDNANDQHLMDASLHQLEKMGTRNWCGYSFSWAACAYARALHADSAVKMLQVFASNFCSVNSFHLNGDQKGGQYSNFTYRPFTLEGNFAFAQGVHELLLQSYKGYLEIFPAVPNSWKNISFQSLRTEGAFLVSADKTAGVVTKVSIYSEKGGLLHIRLPFNKWKVNGIDKSQVYTNEKGISTFTTIKDQSVIFANTFE